MGARAKRTQEIQPIGLSTPAANSWIFFHRVDNPPEKWSPGLGDGGIKNEKK
jgi:hypothetical protein